MKLELELTPEIEEMVRHTLFSPPHSHCEQELIGAQQLFGAIKKAKEEAKPKLPEKFVYNGARTPPIEYKINQILDYLHETASI